jgi:hypothetical protein
VSNEIEQKRVTNRTGPQFRPVAILGLLYFAAFFFLFGLLLVVPEMARVLEDTPGSPEEQEAAAKASVHAIFRPRMPFAIFFALLGTGAGAHFKLLPGFRF